MHPEDLDEQSKDDVIFFMPEDGSPAAAPGEPSAATAVRQPPRASWKILVADDDPEVHSVTRMVLDDFTFDGRGIEFLSAYSGTEAVRLMAEHPDTALILLDVVMESDTAGLDAVRRIRQEVRNPFVRIVLRTGQPGQAPERKVITEYDINDYKEKTELTANKLFTTTTAALRAYRDIRTVEKSRRGLERIIQASARLFEVQSLKEFTNGALTQLTSLLGLDESSLYSQSRSPGFAASQAQDGLRVMAGTGGFASAVDKSVEEITPPEARAILEEAMAQKQTRVSDHAFAGYFRTNDGSENILFVQSWRPLDEVDKDLLRVFSGNIAIAFENVYLNQDILATQKEIVFTLGEVAEFRSKETANHTRRVGEVCALLAQRLGMSDEETDLLRFASAMHDVGKLGIPDKILNKNARLTPYEFEVMKCHAEIGHSIFKHSNRRLMRASATIALQHHERWNGQGYPQALKGTDIDIYGRIVGLVDVYDALCHKRCYKDAWEMDRALEFLLEEREQHFDPELLDLFMEVLEDVLVIEGKFPDLT